MYGVFLPVSSGVANEIDLSNNFFDGLIPSELGAFEESRINLRGNPGL